jgi:glycosyltransferase involved in cell wall biosynthesis
LVASEEVRYTALPSPHPRRRSLLEERVPSVRIIYDVDGWAYHNRALALQKYAPTDFAVSIAALGTPADVARALGDTPVDLVLFLPESPTAAVARALRQRGWHSKLVCSWNTGWPRALDLFCAAYQIADAVIINNQLAWERTGRLPRTHALANGVDLDVFRLTVPIEQRAPKVLWTGSEMARQRKGYDRFVRPLQARLRARGISCETRLVDSLGERKQPPAAMAEWYNSGTVLVCASDVEGTPNPALEAAACGCTVVSTEVGNMPELIRDGRNGYLVERTVDALYEGAIAACANYVPLAREMQADIPAWHWRERCGQFFDLFRHILAGETSSPPRRDLGDEVTVFVTTVGAPSFDVCLAMLRQQDCRFTLRVIDHVAPMNAAFQRMLDLCRTPFYVQVDEDMLLYPDAVRTLYDEIAGAGDAVALVVANLHDPHLRRPIHGVKIFRHATVARYPFQDVESFEKAQVAQLRADGHRQRDIERPLGLHGTHWTPRSIYERYAALERRRRAHPRDLRWFEPYPAIFLERFLEDPSEINFFAVMGVLSGTLASEAEMAAAKDYRTYDALPGHEPLRRFLAAMTSAGSTPST